MFFRFDISASGLLQDKKEYVEPLFTENKYAGLVMLPWLDISALGSKYFTYSSYKPCIVSEKYYLCTVLIQPKAPMGRGWADEHNENSLSIVTACDGCSCLFFHRQEKRRDWITLISIFYNYFRNKWERKIERRMNR